MSLFVDTSVWSLALRRDAPATTGEVRELIRAIEADETLVTTGLVLQELLQGFAGPRDRARILDRFSALPLIVPAREDHIAAAELRNTAGARACKSAPSTHCWRNFAFTTACGWRLRDGRPSLRAEAVDQRALGRPAGLPNCLFETAAPAPRI